MSKMISRFLENEPAVRKTLEHFNALKMLTTNNEIKTARYLRDCLEIIEAGANVLCKRNITLFGAEKTCKFF